MNQPSQTPTSLPAPSEALPQQADRAPIWPAAETPWPLGTIRMASGARLEIPVLRSAPPGAPVIDRATVADNAVAVSIPRPGYLVIEAQEEADGLFEVVLRSSENGQQYVLPVVVELRPATAFHFEPPAGANVRRVSVAGSFNGWNPDADRMERDDDGVFRAELPIPPGEWTYKFVVDGDWISDPSNPRVDTSGYGNSMLTVPGSQREPLVLRYLPKLADAALPGAIHAPLHEGEEWQPGTLRVIVNNIALPEGRWTAEGSLIRLKADDAPWARNNFVTVSGATTHERIAAETFQIDFPDAQRGPVDEVFYFPMTDRFHDGDPTNNRPSNDPRVAPLADYKGGDWAGITQKIREGYFTELGVTGLWISPVNENTYNVERESVPPYEYYTSYHGYWPISMTETNKRFGTMEELREMIATAHEHGIAILLDFVSNHVHVDNPLFVENPGLQSEYDLPDGRKNLRLFDEHPFTTWFDTFIPTIDYEANPHALEIMVDNAIWWLKETGADGFRQDAVKHVPMEFWRTLTTRLLDEVPDREVYQVGETIGGYGLIAEFVGPDLLTGQFDFAGYFTMRDVVAVGRGDMVDLADSVRGALENYPAGTVMSPLLGNHDVARFMAYADGDVLPEGPDKGLPVPPEVTDPRSYDKLQLAYAWLAAQAGPPMLYYGDEVGMTGAGDPDNRRMMQWTDYTAEQLATRDIVGQLFRMRGDSRALRRGHPEVLHADEETVVMSRSTPGEVVLAVFSREGESGREVTVPISVAGNGEPRGVEPLTTKGVTALASDSALEARFRIDGDYAFGFFRVTP